MSARRVALFAPVATALGLVVLGAGSCFNPTYVSGETKCSSSGECPNEWTCQGGVCVDRTSGTAGHPATGGKGGKGGASGGAGTGGTCLTGATHPPVSALITDFSDAVPDPAMPGDYLFGGNVGGRTQGGTARYASGTVGTLSVSNGALTYTATVEARTTANQYPFNGLVLYTSDHACIDGRSYVGVSFSLVVTGTCTVSFIFNDSQHTKPQADPARGACSATDCFASQIAVTGSAMVPYTMSPTVAGKPTAALDPMKLIGFQWQLGLPGNATGGCTAAITIDNVKFY